jgi:alkylation response protein AidB-like acyl-CoA dehydrogenase
VCGATGQGQPVESLLRQMAAEELVVVSTGASDWLDSSGKARAVDGGYRVTGRKVFGSGSPAGDLLMTSAPCDNPADGSKVLHFPVPLNAQGVTVSDNWQAMGMRATGSNDVLLEDVFVPESAVWLRRPKGQWHPFFNMTAIIAMPIVMSVYLGVAEAARDLAVQQIQRKRDDPDVWYLVGEMENALVTGQMAVQGMVAQCAEYSFAPDVATANAVLIRKTIAAHALLTAVEKALEAVGGGGLLRNLGLERLVRDIHGAQFHPLQPKRQHRFTGRVVLGLDPVGG